MKAFLLVLSLAFGLHGFAQQEYFVFIQHEKREPFYVRMGEKNNSSSSSGHVILSRLKDSSYTITIGFPQNQFPEQEFTIRINRKDRGLELKNLADKGWALFDLQTLELINPVKNTSPGSGGASAYNLIKKNDDFARLMAGVVNDTAVLYTVVIEEKKPVTASISTDTVSTDLAGVQKDPPQKITEVVKSEQQSVDIKNDSQQLAKKTEPAVTDTISIAKDIARDAVKKTVEPPANRKETESKPDSIINVKVTDVPKKPDQDVAIPKKTEQDVMKDSVLNPPALPVIEVVHKQATDSGYHMVIVDAKDSIDILIPRDDSPVSVNKVNKQADQPAVKTVIDSANKTMPESNMKNIDSSLNKPVNQARTDSLSINNANDVTSKSDTGSTGKKLIMINSDCRSFASVNDVDKLRVKLVQEKDSDSRINAARKVFKTRCFTALQIKALSEMFPADEQKYKFLETAYPFVSDTGNFKSLVSLLSDPAYVARFRKLVRLD